MHLENHSGLEVAALDLPMDIDHRDFDHVRSGALNGSVDGIPLGSPAHRVVRRTNIPQIAAAARDGLDVAMLARKGDGIVHIPANAGELFEILVNDGAGLFARDSQPL